MMESLQVIGGAYIVTGFFEEPLKNTVRKLRGSTK